MNKKNIYQPFEIVHKTVDECQKGAHQHHFFELVYILSGSGIQSINQSEFEYKADHMFLITPDDTYSWKITSPTEFFLLRFNNIYIESACCRIGEIMRLEFILNNASHHPGCILKNLPDKPVVRTLIEAIITELDKHDIYNKEVISKMVDTIIVIVARNIAKYIPLSVKEDTDGRVLNLINYLQANIYFPEKLKAEALGKYFGISEHYISRYFKAHTGESLKEYVNNLRIKSILSRLKFSDMRVSEISDELGFADESHFNKFFRKMMGKSASQYKKDLKSKSPIANTVSDQSRFMC